MLCFQPAPGALLGMPCCEVSWSNSRISDSISATQFSLVVMTFSNVFGASFAIWYGLYFRFGSLAGRWSLTVIGVVLMYMRQEVELKRWHEVHVLKRPLKDRTL